MAQYYGTFSVVLFMVKTVVWYFFEVSLISYYKILDLSLATKVTKKVF